MTTQDKASANRFRFRAWHKKLWKMVLLDEMSICEEYGTLSFGASDGEYAGIGNLPGSYNRDNEGRHDPSVDCEDMDNWIIMQSTGLTDEDGEELFECDIVDCEIKYASGLRTARYVIWWFSQFGEYVLCDVDGFSLAGHTYHTALSMSKFGDETLLKVGNIYENPDLLPSS